MSDENKSGLAPSGSTVLSTIGAFVAATIMLVLDHYNIHAPAGYEALLGGAIAAVAGYLHSSGRIKL